MVKGAINGAIFGDFTVRVRVPIDKVVEVRVTTYGNLAKQCVELRDGSEIIVEGYLKEKPPGGLQVAAEKVQEVK